MIEHRPVGSGDICEKCQKPRKKHRNRVRAHHVSRGDPCKRCKLPKERHLTRKAVLRRKARDAKRPERRGQSQEVIIGVDGEGHDLPDGRHIYTLLSAVDEHGRLVAEATNPSGLSTKECADFFLSLPQRALKFIFMGSYDFTKIIEDLCPEDIYYIMHPEAREVRLCIECKNAWRSGEKECPECDSPRVRVVRPLQWIHHTRKKERLNLGVDWFNGSFTIAEPNLAADGGTRKGKNRWKRRTKVWDCFKFFQCSFVKAIENWKIGLPEERAVIASMKTKRGSFQDEDPERVRTYCRKECELLAQMMRAVLDACEGAGIVLRNYYGAGSIASALLKEHKVKEHLGPPLEALPKRLQHAVMSAYFGGRFENVITGAIGEEVYSRDVFSAYPYALLQLPCLRCGHWSHVKRDVLREAKNATLAVVRFRVKELGAKERSKIAWMPLPFRDKKRSICYPTGCVGWAWYPEIRAALRGWKGFIEIEEAWVYHARCKHKPWKFISSAYRKRFEWGKDGRGIVMKLGLNACAGKTMQNQGDPPPYKSWIWGGMVTATTRAQVLEGVIQAKDPWNVLAIATDGIFTTEKLTLPKPLDTKTGDLEKPLGGWGTEVHEKGVFFVKPGMYFDDAGSLMRARGVGRQELSNNRQKLVAAFEHWDRQSEVKIRVISRRFFGARSSILGLSQCTKCETGWPGIPLKRCPVCGLVGDRFDTGEMHLRDGVTPAYGRWAERPIDITFEPLPKRETIGRGKYHGRMRVRDLGGAASMAYSPGQTTKLGLLARQAAEEALEQPDWNDEDV